MADHVISQGICVLALTETVFGTDTDQLTRNKLVPTGYEFNQFSVIGVLYKSGLTVTVSKSETTETYIHFENMHCTINRSKVTVKVSIIYRTPPSKMALETQYSLMNGLNT